MDALDFTPDAPLATYSRWQRWLTTAADVKGWFADNAAALWDGMLAYQAARPSVIEGGMLEIGCAYGRAALMLGMHGRRSETLYLIDAKASHARDAAHLVGSHSESRVQGVGAYSERVSLDFIPSRGIRFMHIDGDHGRWALHNDLDIAHRVVGPDGMVVLDDFLAPQFYGVTQGAIEWMTRNPEAFQVVLVGFNKAYLARPRAAQRWQAFIRDELPDHLRACGQPDFTIWRTDEKLACPTFGITQRQFDRDFVTREFATARPELRPDGKPEL